MYLVVRRYAPFAEFGFGFEGDTRTEATTSPTATARTVGVVEFDAKSVRGYRSFSDGTEFLGVGNWLAAKIGKKYSNVKSGVTEITKGPNRISFTVFTAGSNPLLPGAPDIDTFVDFTATFDAASGNTRYEGTVRGDSFPNAEVFVIENSAREVLLFDFRTAGGKNTGPGRIIGEHANLSLGTFSVNSVANGPPKPIAPVMGK